MSETQELQWKEYQKFAHYAARPYWRLDLKDELVQEAILAQAEYELQKGPQHPLRLIRVAKDSCFEYVNLKMVPVTVPHGPEAKAILLGNYKYLKNSSYDPQTLQWMSLILGGNTTDLDGDAMNITTDDPTEQSLLIEELWSLASEVLETKEHAVLYRYYDQQENQESIADSYGVTQQAVQQWIKGAIHKLKAHL